MLRFKLSTFFLLITIVAILLAWYLDRASLFAEKTTLNQEAIRLTQQEFRGFSTYPESTEYFLAVMMWNQNNPKIPLDTFAERERARLSLAEALSGIGGRPVVIAEGTSLSDARAKLEKIGFKIDEKVAANGHLSARKPWMGGYHYVTLQVTGDRVKVASEMQIDP